MRWSSPFLLVVTALAIFGCATRKTSGTSLHLSQAIAGALVISQPTNMIGTAALPADFVADRNYRPMWLQEGQIAIAGTTSRKSTVVGINGAHPEDQRILAQDYGPGAPAGTLLDFATSADGAALATVYADSDSKQTHVLMRSAGDRDQWQNIATVPGIFPLARLSWINRGLIVLTLRSDEAMSRETLGSSLALIQLSDPPSVRLLDHIQCPLNDPSFSPSASLALTQSDHEDIEWLINLGDQRCHEFLANQPLHVLGWAADSSSFLYLTISDNQIPSIYRYNTTRGNTSTVAISSAAAAYADNATIIAFGNDDLSWRRAASSPSRIVIGQIAVQEPAKGQMTINSLGLPLTPAILSRSTMHFAPVSQKALIDTAAVTNQGIAQKLIEYSHRTHAAWVLASAPPDEALSTAWSPNGDMIAVVDSTMRPNVVTVLAAHGG